MSDEALVIAVKAEASAQSAHHRLDRMNGSIDRNNTEIAAIRAELGAKIDALAVTMIRDEGIAEGKRTVRTLQIDSRRFVIATVIALFAAVAYLALNVHISFS